MSEPHVEARIETKPSAPEQPQTRPTGLQRIMPDAELVDPTGQVWDGREAITAMHVHLWSGPARNTQVSAMVRRIRPLGTEAMVVDLDVDVLGFSPAPPGAAVHADGKVKAHLKHVVEKRAGDWKIVASQNTFVAAMPPA